MKRVGVSPNWPFAVKWGLPIFVRFIFIEKLKLNNPSSKLILHEVDKLLGS